MSIHLSSFNLSKLSSVDKNKIEQDKQAAYLVWQVKEAKLMPEQILIEIEKKDESLKADFEASIEKYKKLMSV